MSAPGHCRHCGIDSFLPEEGDTAEQFACDEWTHRNMDGAEWPDGHCPACDEITRIVAEIAAAVAELNRAGEWSESREVDGLIHAATIASEVSE